MGRNIDFVRWFNFPKQITCKNCNKIFETIFDEYDMDCRDEFDKTLSDFCEHCDYENVFNVVLVKKTTNGRCKLRNFPKLKPMHKKELKELEEMQSKMENGEPIKINLLVKKIMHKLFKQKTDNGED